MPNCPDCDKYLKSNTCSCGFALRPTQAVQQARVYIPCGLCRGTGQVTAVYDPEKNWRKAIRSVFRCGCGNGEVLAADHGYDKNWQVWGLGFSSRGWMTYAEYLDSEASRPNEPLAEPAGLDSICSDSPSPKPVTEQEMKSIYEKVARGTPHNVFTQEDHIYKHEPPIFLENDTCHVGYDDSRLTIEKMQSATETVINSKKVDERPTTQILVPAHRAKIVEKEIAEVYSDYKYKHEPPVFSEIDENEFFS